MQTESIKIQNKTYTLKICECDRRFEDDFINYEDYPDLVYKECACCHNIIPGSLRAKTAKEKSYI